MLRSLLILVAFLTFGAAFAFPQVVTTSTLDGAVTDPQKTSVAGAQVLVTNIHNGQTFKASTDIRGYWLLPAMSEGVYKVSVSMKGFRTFVLENVQIDAAIPTTANARLELGPVAEVVEVQGGAELVQTTDATVNSTLEGRMVLELPEITRGGLDLLVSQPGVQTAGANRYSSINGLPNSALNVTIDGLNTQDQLLKSSNGFFTFIPITDDSIEEVTLTTSAAAANATGEGAAQIKFVTRSGTNQLHGGVFEQIRNTALNANYYFNNIDGLPRDIVQLNQFGGHIGGPIWKNKLFFFTNIEQRIQPASASESYTVLTPAAVNGNYTYMDPVTNQLVTVNVLKLALDNGYQGTADPIMAKTFNQINALVSGSPNLINNISSSGDYIRDTFYYQARGEDLRLFTVSRIDYNLNSRNQLSISYSYNNYNSTPDILNGDVALLPGTGTVLGAPAVGGQLSNRFAGIIALRSTITSHLTNEFRAGLDSGTIVFDPQADSAGSYAQWRGYNIALTAGEGYAVPGDPASGSLVSAYVGGSRRNSPTRNLSETMSWLKGPHVVSFGGNWTQVNLWDQTIGNETIPTMTLGIDAAQNDPIHNGGPTDIFSNANFPDAPYWVLDDAAALYADLTGRVASISKSVALNSAGQYGANPPIDHVLQREFGLFVQDSWKLRRSLTVDLGLRYEWEGPLEDLTGTYSSVTLASLWGISGIGNEFQPGLETGVQPQFVKYFTPYNNLHRWNPSGGFAWQLPAGQGPWHWLLGDHPGATVLRAGYAISTIREGTAILEYMLGSNPGRSVDDSVDPDNYPQYFGTPGSVTLSSATLPTRPYPASPSYPFSPQPTDPLNGFEPNLKLGYVQSWNFGLQRELGQSTVVEVRYTGNHGTDLWRQISLNEVNIFENGFLSEWQNAYNNLMIARETNPASTNFGNQGLPGQADIPFIQLAYGRTSSQNFVNRLLTNQPGLYANLFSYAQPYLNNWMSTGQYPANLFIENPAVSSGNSWIVGNWGSSYYDALQIEVRRRMSKGLMLEGSYVWSKSLVNGPTSDSSLYFPSPTTLRNINLDKQPTPFDIPQALKLNVIYELPFGPGRPFLATANRVVRKMVEGWQIAAVDRNQSGTPSQLLSGREGINQNDPGVVLHNMTASQLQSMMGIVKTTGSNGTGLVSYLPQSLIDNSVAAFQTGGQPLNPNAPYIGPQLTAGQLGYEVFLWGPWQNHFDLNLTKTTTIKERYKVEFTAQFLNVLNITNFQLANTTLIDANFGQTTSAYQDLSNAQDPGARMIEFRLRVNF
ncbi:MAG: TonB-dependent receptor [Bryobacteraceae bacterium]